MFKLKAMLRLSWGVGEAGEPEGKSVSPEAKNINTDAKL